MPSSVGTEYRFGNRRYRGNRVSSVGAVRSEFEGGRCAVDGVAAGIDKSQDRSSVYISVSGRNAVDRTVGDVGVEQDTVSACILCMRYEQAAVGNIRCQRAGQDSEAFVGFDGTWHRIVFR